MIFSRTARDILSARTMTSWVPAGKIERSLASACSCLTCLTDRSRQIPRDDACRGIRLQNIGMFVSTMLMPMPLTMPRYIRSSQCKHFFARVPYFNIRADTSRSLPIQSMTQIPAANTRGPAHGAVEAPVFSFGHAATVRDGPERVHSQELQDAQWWKKGGASTVNQERNRDVEGYWAAANEAHADVGGDLRQVRGSFHAPPTTACLPLACLAILALLISRSQHRLLSSAVHFGFEPCNTSQDLDAAQDGLQGCLAYIMNTIRI